MSGPLWTLITILGPLLLLAVLFWAWARNRRRSGQVSLDRTEQATHDYYIEADARDKRSDAASH